MRQEGYDLAQICINGHVINPLASTFTLQNKKFCDECGAETITNCKKCEAAIKGTYHYPGMIAIGLGYKPPKFCDNCGQQFPWTEIKLKASNELVNLSEKLSDEEKADLNKSIEDLVKETPNVPVAQIKFRKYLGKVGQEVANGIKDILVDIISETIKKSIWI